MTISLLNLLNQSNYDFYFLVVDDFLDIKLPQLTNFISLSPKSLNLTLTQKNSGRLLSHPTTISFIKNHSQTTKRIPAIIPFKPSSKIDLICQQNKWLLVSNPAQLNRLFEDKIKFVQICRQNNIPTLPAIIDVFSSDSFNSAQKNFGQLLVIQTHFGWAGNSSYLADNYNSVSKKITPGFMVKYSPYLSGYSLINNCCLTSTGLIQSPPGLQYTGLSSLTQNPLATVGRQWPAPISKNISDQVFNLTNQFSSVLEHHLYRGFFGLDFFVSENQVYLLECNARLTASFAFYTQIELNNNVNPLFLFHLAEFTDILPSFNLSHEQSRFSNKNLVGSEITLKNQAGATIKKHHNFIPFSRSANPIQIDSTILAKVL